MANDNPEFQSLNGQADTTESATTANISAPRSPNESRKPSAVSTTPAPPLRKRSSNNLVPAATASAGSSPRTSRNTSPIRKDSRPQPLSNPNPTQPSAAAIQRALSAANAPQLQAAGVSDAASRLPRPPRSAGGSGDNTPHWPTSPRLKSPPPSGPNSRRGSAATGQKNVGSAATATPGINVQSATPQSSTPPPTARQSIDENSKATPQLQTPTAPKALSRGPSGKSTLETVQENSVDDVKEPSPAAVKAAADLKPLTKISDKDGTVPEPESSTVEGEKHIQQGESGSESAGAKNEKKRDQSSAQQRPKNMNSKSYASITSTKSRQNPEGKQNMTVETETVASIPQSALSAGDRTTGGRNDNSGSVKLKPSIETIRPKKERKKTSQKARSINQSTASSKADIFEARVANAVDEANSSESDETFVYESNPPEPQRRTRHHSRTPSVTSSHSVADQNRGSGMRNFGDMLDDRRVAGKRSMKFSNNPYNDIDSPDSKNGSVRSHQPRHFGRLGRGGSEQQDSPFTQASKLRSGQRNSRPNSPRDSPRSYQHQRSIGLFAGKKQEPSFDLDAEGADDERTPLFGTVRTPRGGRLPRRINSTSGHSIDEYYGVRRHSRCGRFGGCVLGLVVFAAVILSALAFLVMSNRPMYNVKIKKVQNVLASEQELMLDLLVGAVNPNALGITVSEMNIDIFAKSEHVGSGSLWRDQDGMLLTSSASGLKRRRRRSLLPSESTKVEDSTSVWQDLSSHWHTPNGGVDEGTDPPDDDDLEKDAQTMLLGRIFEFDQALTFEASPIKRHRSYSVGELRLERPGNKTETGGSARWEKVLQYPFELIIRGVLKYQLPISSRMQNAAVSASIIVHPEEGVDKFGNMRLEKVDNSEKWQWIEWEDLEDDEEGTERIVEVDEDTG